MFIVDQEKISSMMMLKPELHRFGDDRKEVVRSLLDVIAFSHMKLASSTAKYWHAMSDMFRQTNERHVGLYGGLNDVSSSRGITICALLISDPGRNGEVVGIERETSARET